MSKTTPLKEWVRRISEEEMPVFAHTARSIATASKGLDTPVAELAHLILQDSSMTAKVLRLANSAYYNPSGRPVNTISRGILFLGFDVVRSIALTIAIIDPLIKGLQHEYVVREMARCFHAAVQAKAIAQARGASNNEEVFIAALLYRLGNMAFWCFPCGQANALDNAYQQWDQPEKAENAVLGFNLRQLTQGLNQEWHLSELLKSILTAKSTSPEREDLQQAFSLITAVEEGWGSIAAKRCCATIAELVNRSSDETWIMINKAAFEAVQVTREFGIETVGKHIPLPDKSIQDGHSTVDSEPRPQPDLQLQMGMLRELTAMLHEKADINAVISTVMEAVYRVLGMERTVIAFISPEDGHLRAKYMLGDQKDKLKRGFNFAVAEQSHDFITYVLNQKEGCWLNAKTRVQLEPLISDDMRQCLGVLEFFIMPIRINHKGRGVVYADCKYSGRSLTDADFQTFVHFSEHITIAFDLLAKSK
ncbi:MAG: HDOD domain-containing protein [Gammaproteobacteria bacterium]|nr:HDOD domain-containing protein [Gammaproteobacteria bacterium]